MRRLERPVLEVTPNPELCKHTVPGPAPCRPSEGGVEVVMQIIEGVQVSGETAAALGSFSQRIGVPRETVVSVMLGLAENERRDRNGAMVLAKLLMTCQGALGQDQAKLKSEIAVALEEFEVPALV